VDRSAASIGHSGLLIGAPLTGSFRYLSDEWALSGSTSGS
jgi:hypothetical protein